MSDLPPEGATTYRLRELERKLERLDEDARGTRSRVNEVHTQVKVLGVEVVHAREDIGQISESVDSLRSRVLALALSIAGGAALFSFTVFSIWGQ